MTTLVIETTDTVMQPPPVIETVLETGQGPAGAPGNLLEQELPFDPTLNFENALA